MNTSTEFININNIFFPPIKYSIAQEISDSFYKLPFKRHVLFDNEILEFNFRVLETYLPEILWLIAAEGKPFIKSLECLSKRKLYGTIEFTERVLRHKMCYFIEALLYSNIFNGVWKGEYLNSRIYIAKNMEQLEFYTMFDMRKLVSKMLSHTLIQISGPSLCIQLEY